MRNWTPAQKKAARSIAFNGFFLLVVAGLVISILVMMVTSESSGTSYAPIGTGGFIVILLAIIAWNTRKRRR